VCVCLCVSVCRVFCAVLVCQRLCLCECGVCVWRGRPVWNQSCFSFRSLLSPGSELKAPRFACFLLCG
jgi:hypothetical protein